MEGNKQVGSSSSSSSSSSFTSDLFGTKDLLPSSTGIFGSIFAPSPKVLGRGSIASCSEVAGKKQEDSTNDAVLNPKSGVPDLSSKSNEGDSQNIPYRDISSIYQQQKVQPCHLSSSIYYGGQDVFNHPQNTNPSSMNATTFKKDGSEDDTGTASRGNWWQGGLYY